MNAPLFPISPLLPQIQQHLAVQPRLVLEAPPGAGKTTQVPLALLEASWLQGRKIILLEPRRVAARSAALFMARQLGEEVGGTVGYRIRFENKVSARTRIEVVTEGILTRMLQEDPMLEEVGAILFDEFHERHLSGDLGLALALDVQAQLRDDLRLVVMSATLDGERPARFLDAPRLSSEGRSYPVTVSHFPARRDETLELQVRRAVQQALADHPGDLLVFLPGQREIARVRAGLQESLDGNVEVLALHGELPVEQQARVLQMASDGRRRVVLATNVAESSVTLPGVRVVIDSGRRANRATTPTAASPGWTWCPSPRRRPTSAPVAPVAWPKAWPGGCGRSRSDWSRSAVPRSTRWNWPDWRWNWPRGAAATCASSTRHRPARWVRRANCCNARVHCRTRARSPHSGAVYWRWVRTRGWRRCCWQRPMPARRRWPPIWPPCWKRATRCAGR